ncbi:hypothetical protein NP493_937g00047 [Ridgeia piscesae]|uniref:Uncharacterized protein n=1 Tax=Ridgeia piscesae TaxID=27915 RepID=A0AAD9KK64_RIDPI|nr:hypothetical protein NP493_937g00047 [Ridgeia piscesae]
MYGAEAKWRCVILIVYEVAQFDTLHTYLTCRETLWMYAYIRGIPTEYIPDEVDRLLQTMLLEPFADKRSGTLSGGNMRKLSVAVAMLGEPLVILLDEPTCGLDPVAQRQAWKVLSQFRESGRTIVLSSHSMDECEALCNRLVIMVGGRLQCIGSLQHLKSKFGKDYMLVIQMSRKETGEFDDSMLLEQFLSERFHGCVLTSSDHGQLHYSVPEKTVTWPVLFSVLEKAKNDYIYHMEDYSICQTTLEQIFIDFAHDASNRQSQLSI